MLPRGPTFKVWNFVDFLDRISFFSWCISAWISQQPLDLEVPRSIYCFMDKISCTHRTLNSICVALCKEIQIIYRLFLVNCNLLHVPRILFQLASSVGGRVINWIIGCPIIIWTGLNIKISKVQKVYEWWSCSFAKMIPWLNNHFVKISAWSLIYFLN